MIMSQGYYKSSIYLKNRIFFLLCSSNKTGKDLLCCTISLLWRWTKLLLLTVGEKIFLERSVKNSFFLGSVTTSDGMKPRSVSIDVTDTNDADATNDVVVKRGLDAHDVIWLLNSLFSWLCQNWRTALLLLLLFLLLLLLLLLLVLLL